MIATEHTANITDVAPDVTGRFVATCSEDKTIRILGMEAGNYTPLCQLEGHEGAVLRVAWAHPRFSGHPLASAGADGQLVVWKERGKGSNEWIRVYAKAFNAAVQCIDWAPNEVGQVIACGCAGGQIHVLSFNEREWETLTIENAHPASVNGVSWCPCLPPSCLLSLPPCAPQPPAVPFPRFVSCGNERSVRIWRYAPQDRQWIPEHELDDLLNTTCVRDVAWASNIGLPFTYIAAGSDEGWVAIWVQPGLDGRWKAIRLPPFDSPICRLSWSTVGTFLSVACSSGNVSIWTETPNGTWKSISTLVAPIK